MITLVLSGCPQPSSTGGGEGGKPFADVASADCFRGNRTIVLKWREDRNADKYIVMRGVDGVDGVGEMKEIYAGSEQYYTDMGVERDIRYVYRVDKQAGSKVYKGEGTAIGVGSDAEVDYNEPNDEVKQATELNSFKRGVIYYYRFSDGRELTDRDWYKVAAGSGQAVRVRVREDGAGAESMLKVRGAGGGVLPYSGEGSITVIGGADGYGYFEIGPDEDQFVGPGQAGGTSRAYRVEVGGGGGAGPEEPGGTEGFVAVTGIAGVPFVASPWVSLALSGIVEPATATKRTIVWTVQSSEPAGAYINGGNRLWALAAGTVTVEARIRDGRGVGIDYVQECVVTVSGGSEPWTEPGGGGGEPVEEKSELFVEDGSGRTIFLLNDLTYRGNDYTFWKRTGTSAGGETLVTAELGKESGNYAGGYGIFFKEAVTAGHGESMLVILVQKDGNYAIGKVIEGQYNAIAWWKYSVYLRRGYGVRNTVAVKWDGGMGEYVVVLNGIEETRFRDETEPRCSGNGIGLVAVVTRGEQFPQVPVKVGYTIR